MFISIQLSEMHRLMGRVKKNNFTKDERKALKKLQRNVKLRVHEFDGSCAFAIVTDNMTKV